MSVRTHSVRTALSIYKTIEWTVLSYQATWAILSFYALLVTLSARFQHLILCIRSVRFTYPTSFTMTAPSNPTLTLSAIQTFFGGLAALSAFLALAFALWKFQGKFRAHCHHLRRRQRSFELEAQLPEVRWLHSISQDEF